DEDGADDDEMSKTVSISVRDSFTVSDSSSWLLVSADYNQMEMRILAIFCGDAKLIELFSSRADNHAESDVYKLMASICFSRPIDKVTKEERTLAKQISLGLIYGMGPELLASKMTRANQPMTTQDAAKHMAKW